MRICQQCGTQYNGEVSFCPLDGEVLQDDHAEMVGRVLDGQYQIEEFIAEGGMGAVYKARHTLLGDRVAIKVLPPEMRRNAAWLKRFQREGQAARRFHHPNSVIVHDLRTSSEGEIYLVMEFVEGRTLDTEVAAHGGRLQLTDALRIIEPVASVLDAAHAQGVVHRDLKPSNIMITNRGVVKLLDLGVAKVSDLGGGATTLTVTGQLLGTPYYMSPEQWGELPRDGSEEIDGRTDIYSLGVVVYKITTGRFPCDGTSVVTLRRAHCREMPRPPEELDPNFPPAWSRAVMRALSKDRNDRQQTAGEFAAELRASVGGAEMRYERERAVLPTLNTQPQATAPSNVYSTPPNLNAATINAAEVTQNAAEVTQNIQPTIAPSSPPAQVSFKSPRLTRSPWLLPIIASVLILAVGGFMLWKWRGSGRGFRRQGANQTKSSTQNEASDASTNSDQAATAGDESIVSESDAFIRYNLLLNQSVLDSPVIASGRDPVKAGQIVQFDFRFRESGYLYIFAHDNDGNMIVMPVGDAEGMEKLMAGAQVTAGTEAVVPSLPLVKLDSPSGVENFTVLFVNKPLTLPFASATLPLDGSFRKLTADEQRQVEELRKQSAPTTLQFNGDIVMVKLDGERGSKPVVFDIKIKLQGS